MTNNLVKHDMNFLEYSLWFQNEREASSLVNGATFEDRDGFIYKTAYKLPVKKDLIYLFALLVKSQSDSWNNEFEMTRYELLKMCGCEKSGKNAYKRLEDSLKRWMHVVIEFSGTFYDGNEYQIMQFHIIDSWKVCKKTKNLQIRLSPDFIKQQQNSNFFKLVNFDEVKSLRTSISTRLYEILVKAFQSRSEWSIDCLKLAEKIPIRLKYPSHIIPKIKSALEHINEYTSNTFSLSVKKICRGKSILTFSRIEEKKEGHRSLEVSILPEERKDEYEECISKVKKTESHKKTIRTMIQKSLLKNGTEYTLRNIEYTNRNVKKSYRLFLQKSLKEDWGREQYLELKEKREHLQQQKEIKITERKKEKEESKHSQELVDSAKRMLSIMPDSEKKKLEDEAKQQLGFELSKDYSSDSFQGRAIRMTMSNILIKKLFG